MSTNQLSGVIVLLAALLASGCAENSTPPSPDERGQEDEETRTNMLVEGVQESYEKISERLGKKPAHLRSICSKSLAQLRKYLDTETVHLLPKE